MRPHEVRVVTFRHGALPGVAISLCEDCARAGSHARAIIGILGAVQHGEHRGQCDGCQTSREDLAYLLGEAYAEYHVTRAAGRTLYGHRVRHCDASGCAGHERRLGEVEDAGAAAALVGTVTAWMDGVCVGAAEDV